LSRRTASARTQRQRAGGLTLQPALGTQEDVIVRYGEEADFTGAVLEFLMRQDEVLSALVKGQSITKAQFWASHPELRDEL
jgi:hypothetical protein